MIFMVMGKRIIVLVVMALMSTASPAVYQKAVQPRVEGANCSIDITALRIRETETTSRTNEIVFDAYLRIDNPADVAVVLSELDLDVYHYSKSESRFKLIGKFNTSQEYEILANSYIQDYPTGYGQRYYPGTGHESIRIIATLILYGADTASESPANEAITELVKKGSTEVILKGVAKIGPFTFQYKRKETLNVEFFDSNFVITDVFNYYPEG